MIAEHTLIWLDELITTGFNLFLKCPRNAHFVECTGTWRGLVSGFHEKLTAFRTAKSGGRSPSASNVLIDFSVKGSEMSPFFRFEELAKICKTRFSTLYAAMEMRPRVAEPALTTIWHRLVFSIRGLSQVLLVLTLGPFLHDAVTTASHLCFIMMEELSQTGCAHISSGWALAGAFTCLKQPWIRCYYHSKGIIFCCTFRPQLCVSDSKWCIVESWLHSVLLQSQAECGSRLSWDSHMQMQYSVLSPEMFTFVNGSKR